MLRLNDAFFAVAVIGSVGNDDVVEETDAHKLAGTGETLGKIVVHLTGMQAARRMVVYHGDRPSDRLMSFNYIYLSP